MNEWISPFKPIFSPRYLVTTSEGVTFLIQCTLFIVVLVAFVPLTPKLPAASLDPSWALGLNQALAQGLSFGREIIFTLGPYSSVYTTAYHPATVFIMMAGSLYLAVSYWVCLVFLMKNIPWRWPLAFIALLAGMLCSRDSLFYSYVLLAGLASCKLVLAKENSLATSWRFLLVLLLAPFGLLALIKGTFFLLSMAVSGLCTLLFVSNKKYLAAVIMGSTPLITMGLFWVGCGQLLSDLPLFCYHTLYMASAFTQAMSSEANWTEPGLYLFNSLLILTAISLQIQLPRALRIGMLVIYSCFLFISFKSGFTRQYGHVFIAGTSILIAAFLLPFFSKSKWIIPVLLISLFTSNYLEYQNGNISIWRNFTSTYSSFWHGFKNWINDSNWLQRDYQLSMYFLQQQADFPLFKGTSDIYSSNQTYLIASGNTWAPRPVFQSYSVFTSKLAEKNKQHLLGKNSPDTVFFKLDPIDNRIPALEDGASWLILITNYHWSQTINHFLVLKKNHAKQLTRKPTILLPSEHHVFGEQINVPNSKQPVFVTIDVKPTILGSLATLLMASSDLQIHMQLKDGTSKNYRFIANMAQSGFILSPLVETTEEFANLFKNSTELDTKKIKSFSISTAKSYSWQWNKKFEVQLKSYSLPPT